MKIGNTDLASIFESHMILRYLTSGTIASIVQLTTLYVLVQTVSAPETALSCAAFALAVVVNYSLQRAFTFNSSEPHTVLFPKFAMVAVLGFCLNGIIFFAFSRFLHYMLAQACTIVIVLIFNFMMNKKFVFSYRA